MAAAPAPAPLTAAQTRWALVRPPAAGLAATDDVMAETSRANSIVTSLKFINFVTAPAPALPAAPAYVLYGVFLAAIQHSDAAADVTAFKAASLLTDDVTMAGISLFNHELAKGGIFNSEFDSLDDFCNAVAESTTISSRAGVGYDGRHTRLYRIFYDAAGRWKPVAKWHDLSNEQWRNA